MKFTTSADTMKELTLEVVKTVIQVSLERAKDLITYVTDRPGHDMRYAIDPTKIHE